VIFSRKGDQGDKNFLSIDKRELPGSSGQQLREIVASACAQSPDTRKKAGERGEGGRRDCARSPRSRPLSEAAALANATAKRKGESSSIVMSKEGEPGKSASNGGLCATRFRFNLALKDEIEEK